MLTGKKKKLSVYQRSCEFPVLCGVPVFMLLLFFLAGNAILLTPEAAGLLM